MTILSLAAAPFFFFLSIRQKKKCCANGHRVSAFGEGGAKNGCTYEVL
jgi:hypothetical protein